jgi:hypothetical protein
LVARSVVPKAARWVDLTADLTAVLKADPKAVSKADS